MRQNAKRIALKEANSTLTSKDLAKAVQELDRRDTNAEMYMDYIRVAGKLVRIDYYSEAARTNLVAKRDLTYTANKVSSTLDTFYNSDGSVDSTVTTTFIRVSGKVVSSDSVFATSEDDGC